MIGSDQIPVLEENRLNVGVRFAGLLGRGAVLGFFAVYGFRLVSGAMAMLARPLNYYTLGEMGRFFGGIMLLMVVLPKLLRWPEDDETLRLWAWGCVLLCSSVIFALVAVAR